MKKRILAWTLAAVMAVAMVGCGSSGKDTDSKGTTGNKTTEKTEVAAGESVSQDHDLLASVSVDFTTLDPLDTNDTLSGDVQRLMMDGLFGFDEDMNVVNMLAESYEANDDATEFTFKLREGVSFSDGTPWNAEAAKANFDRWADKSLGLKRTTFLSNVLDKTEIVDEYTIKVTLVSPFGAFINNLAHPCTVCVSPKQIEKGSATVAAEPVGTGQYTFKEWVAGEHLTLELNKDWWGYNKDICGGTPLAESDAGFKTITFKPVAESATRVAMLQSGEADLIWPVPSENFEALSQDSNLTVASDESIVVRYLFMNNQKAPFNDVRVRQAINYAIDKDAYCAVVKNGLATPADSIIGTNVQFHVANDVYKYNIEKAKELLTEAGYPDGFTTTLMYASTTANQKQAEFLKQQLDQVGINLQLNGMENAILQEKVASCTSAGADAEVDMYTIGWSPSTGDADWGIRPLVAIESEPPMSYNICYYENKEVESLLYDALGTADSDKRAEAYEKIQNIVWDESPMVCLAFDSNTWANNKNIINVGNMPDGGLWIRNARMAK